jgi:hypothetical protein
MKNLTGEIEIMEEIVEIEAFDGLEVLEVTKIRIYQTDKRPHPRGEHVHVEVVTTSGAWPAEGFAEVHSHQAVKVALHRTVKKLEIKDTNNWVAKVGTRELNPDQSYQAQGLSGHVVIDYGPREGGGGSNE